MLVSVGTVIWYSVTCIPSVARAYPAAVNGIEAYPVEVEVNAGYSNTVLVIVCLPDAAVKESRGSARKFSAATGLLLNGLYSSRERFNLRTK